VLNENTASLPPTPTLGITFRILGFHRETRTFYTIQALQTEAVKESSGASLDSSILFPFDVKCPHSTLVTLEAVKLTLVV
jgi:hypothetical protein